jgi:hypothetical protein
LGDPRVNKYNTDATAVVNELESAYRARGGSEKGIQQWRDNLSASSSPAQQKAVLGEIMDLLGSKIDALGDQYNKGMGTTADGLQLLSPKAQSAYNALSGRTNAAPSDSAPAKTSEAPSAAPQLAPAAAQNKTAQWALQQAIKNGDQDAIAKLRAKGYVQ